MVAASCSRDKPRVAEKGRGSNRFDGYRGFVEDDRLVPIDARCPGAADRGVEPVLDCGRRRLYPLALDRAGRADSRLADPLALSGDDIQRHDVLAPNAARLAPQCGAMTAGKQKPIVGTSAALRQSIGVAREQRMTQRLVADVRRNVAAERVACNSLQLLRDLAHCRTHLRVAGTFRRYGGQALRTRRTWRTQCTHCTHCTRCTQRERRTGRCRLWRASSVDENPRESRMKGNALQPPAERRDARARWRRYQSPRAACNRRSAA